MSEDADRKLYFDEVNRCHRLSLEVTAPAPPLRTVQTRNARYYAERGRVLGAVGVERAVAFLREEALAALAGTSREGWSERWFRLHRLEFGDLAPGATMTDAMSLGVEKLVREGVADLVADHNREERAAGERRRRAMSCTWCQGNNGCNGACM